VKKIHFSTRIADESEEGQKQGAGKSSRLVIIGAEQALINPQFNWGLAKRL